MTKKETLKLFEERKVRTVWDDEKEKCLTEKGIYVDRNLHVQKLNSQECFYEAAYANAEKRQK